MTHEKQWIRNEAMINIGPTSCNGDVTTCTVVHVHAFVSSIKTQASDHHKPYLALQSTKHFSPNKTSITKSLRFYRGTLFPRHKISWYMSCTCKKKWCERKITQPICSVVFILKIHINFFQLQSETLAIMLVMIEYLKFMLRK